MEESREREGPLPGGSDPSLGDLEVSAALVLEVLLLRHSGHAGRPLLLAGSRHARANDHLSVHGERWVGGRGNESVCCRVSRWWV